MLNGRHLAPYDIHKLIFLYAIITPEKILSEFEIKFSDNPPQFSAK
jgi:hypothetical protein